MAKVRRRALGPKPLMVEAVVADMGNIFDDRERMDRYGSLQTDARPREAFFRAVVVFQGSKGLSSRATLH